MGSASSRAKKYIIRRQTRRLTHVKESGELSVFNARQKDLLRLKEKVEESIAVLQQPVLFCDGKEIGLLKDFNFRLECADHFLVLGLRLESKSVRRRVLEVKLTSEVKVTLATHHLGKAQSFEIIPASGLSLLEHFKQSRREFQKYIEGLILRNFPKAKILHSVIYSDLEHSLSGKYVRLIFRSGQSHWNAIAVSPWEDQSAVDGILSAGLIWVDILKTRSISHAWKLLLIAPIDRLMVLKSRLSWIRNAGKQIQLLGLNPDNNKLAFIDIADSGNLDTSLTQVHTYSPGENGAGSERFKRLTSLAPGEIEAIQRTGSNWISFRIRGLEFAQLHQGKQEKLMFGIEKMHPVRSPADWNLLEACISKVLQERSALASGHHKPVYSLQSERWLESLVLKNIRLIDADLDPRFVYPQVPAFLGGDRGMIDVLSVTREGRLAILELKVSEDIELPMQGLDYWLRVRWHHLRQEFQFKGYFPGLTLNSACPVLYFVCPQFRYHSSFPMIASHIHSGVPLVQVGINENWRSGIQVVQKRRLN